jgi:hypothetical protein
MILGHGDISSVLKDKKDWLFFASGVSNSKETNEDEYTRERGLLYHQDYSKHIVYFSSLCVFYSQTRYADHKRSMEMLVKKWFPSYTIIRLGNITWGKNPHTLINHFKAHKDSKVEDVYRFVVDKEEFLYWLNLIPDWSCEMNIPGRRMKVIDIIKEYV